VLLLLQSMKKQGNPAHIRLLIITISWLFY